jgi:hypothetical protein
VTASRTSAFRHDRAGEPVAAPGTPCRPGRPALLAYDSRHDPPGATGAGGEWPRPDGSRSARPHTRTRRPPLMTVRDGSSSCRAGRERQHKHQTAGFPGHQIGARRPGSQRAARLPNAPDLHDRLIHRRSCVWRSTRAASSGYAASWAGSTPTSHPPGRQSSSRHESAAGQGHMSAAVQVVRVMKSIRRIARRSNIHDGFCLFNGVWHAGILLTGWRNLCITESNLAVPFNVSAVSRPFRPTGPR